MKLKLILLTLMIFTNQMMASSKNIWKINELNEEIMEQFFQGKMEDMVIECPQGTSFPLQLKTHGEFLALDITTEPKVTKSCYLKFDEKNQLVISSDLKEWKSMQEFFTGKMSVTLHVSQNGENNLVLDLEVNERK